MAPVELAAQRLVLLGGGHAHVHLLSRAARYPLAPAGKLEIVLVSPFERHLYSGMVPGLLQGTYTETELSFDLRALAADAGARFVQAAAQRIDPVAGRVEVDGERLPYDLLSLDIGSEPAGLATPGVREHASTVRPMNRAVALRQRAEALLATVRNRQVAVVVAGGGAAGVEVALALARLGRIRGARPEVTIVEASPTIVPEFSTPVRRLAERILAARDVRLRTGRRVAAVEADRVELDDGTHTPSELTVWLAGAAASQLLARSAVPKDAHGCLLVGETLQAVDGSPLFGAGDCVGIAGFPALAKAGVYAVRESPILDHNLRATLAGGTLRRYRPQATFLALLNSADGKAIWRWHGLAGHSQIAWWLKDRIDRAFMKRYQGAR